MPVKKSATKKIKKATAKQATVSVVSPKEQEVNTPEASIVTRRSFDKKRLVLPLIIIIVFIVLFIMRSAFVVAIVNGQPVTRATYNHELEKDAGKKAITDLVNNMLILQEANNKHVNASDTEINAEVKKFEDSAKSSGTTLTQQLADNNLTMDDLKSAIKVNLLLRKLMAKDLVVTDKEVNDYIDKSKQAGSQEDVTAAMRGNIKQQLVAQKFQTKAPEYLDSLKSKSKINYYISH